MWQPTVERRAGGWQQTTVDKRTAENLLWKLQRQNRNPQIRSLCQILGPNKTEQTTTTTTIPWQGYGLPGGGCEVDGGSPRVVVVVEVVGVVVKGGARTRRTAKSGGHTTNNAQQAGRQGPTE